MQVAINKSLLTIEKEHIETFRNDHSRRSQNTVNWLTQRMIASQACMITWEIVTLFQHTSFHSSLLIKMYTESWSSFHSCYQSEQFNLPTRIEVEQWHHLWVLCHGKEVEGSLDVYPIFWDGIHQHLLKETIAPLQKSIGIMTSTGSILPVDEERAQKKWGARGFHRIQPFIGLADMGANN